MKYCPLCEEKFADSQTTCPRDGVQLVLSREWAPQSVIKGKYRILAKLGQGGMGVVYKAEDIFLKRTRALKVMSPDLASDPSFLRRFRQEAQAACDLIHPNIVRVNGMDQADDGSLFIEMEYVEGPSLRQLLQRAEGPLPVARALGIARGIAEALSVAHTAGMVHRDIKPDNVLIATDAQGREIAKVLDFGIVAMKESTGKVSSNILMTPAYAPPEQYRGMKSNEIDGRADLYALGVTLFEMLTGRLPFEAHTHEGWMHAHLDEQPAPPSKFSPALPAAIDALVLHLLMKNRDDRTPSADALLEELKQLDGEVSQTKTKKETQGTAEQVAIPSQKTAIGQITPGAPVEGTRAHYPPTAPTPHSHKDPIQSEPSAPSKPQQFSGAARILFRFVLVLAAVGLYFVTINLVLLKFQRQQTSTDSRQIQTAEAVKTPPQESQPSPAVSDSKSATPPAKAPGQIAQPEKTESKRAESETKTPQPESQPSKPESSSSGAETRVPAPTPSQPPETKREPKPNPSEPAAPIAPIFDLERTLESHSIVLSISFSPDGRLLATGSIGRIIDIWDLATGKRLRILNEHDRPVGSLSFSPDGRALASGSDDQSIIIWDVVNGRIIKSLFGHPGGVESVVFGPSGRMLASGGRDNSIRLWDVQTGQNYLTLFGHTDYVVSIALIPDGRILASGSADGTIKLWNLVTGQNYLTLSGHTGHVSSIAFSPDGRVLASVNGGKTIVLWEVATGLTIRTLSGSSSGLETVVFSPDGKWLASCGGFNDNTIKLWSASTGQIVGTLMGHGRELKSLAFSPDGKLIASGSEDKTIKLWRRKE